MTLSFGSVQRYDAERGFGFVSCTIPRLQRSTQEIFFHIKTIKYSYYELAQKLDSGSYHSVNFWYEVEKTDKGEQVSKLWASTKDIPSKELDSLTAQIEEVWRNIKASTPSWLEQVTLDLVGQTRRDELDQEREKLQCERKEAEEKERDRRKAESSKQLAARRGRPRLLDKQKTRNQADRLIQVQQPCLSDEQKRKKQTDRLMQVKATQAEAIQERLRLLDEQKRKKQTEHQAQVRATQEAKRITEKKHQAALRVRTLEIQKICEMYGIKTLTHFTHIRNLPSILQHGLLGRVQLESMSLVEAPKYNDIHRLDGYPEAVCLSISFPNYRMFYKYIKCSNPSDWVVLVLESHILWELDCKFYQENAASSNAKESFGERVAAIRKQPKALRQMFENYKHIERQTLGIPSNFTTNPQAEVLVFNPIPPQYINAVHFNNLAIYQQWVQLNSGNYSQSFYGETKYFAPRQDWQIWQT